MWNQKPLKVSHLSELSDVPAVCIKERKGMVVILTDFRQCTWLRPTSYWEICECHSPWVYWKNLNIETFKPSQISDSSNVLTRSIGRIMFLTKSSFCFKNLTYPRHTDKQYSRLEPFLSSSWTRPLISGLNLYPS